jgi:SAM-dependent methyltransferase
MRTALRQNIKQLPILGDWATQVYRLFKARRIKPPVFLGTCIYWDQRYQKGGDSGVGSYGKFADFKAEVLNNFVVQHEVRSVIEFGCGDGNQLSLAKYPQYIGFDISATAVGLCKRRFASDKTKVFKNLSEYCGEKANLTLSLDVIFHLVEDELFFEHMKMLFAASERYVAIYSSNSNNNRGMEGTHVRNRKFTDWIRRESPHWELLSHTPNRFPYRGDYTTGSWSDLFIYEKGSNK